MILKHYLKLLKRLRGLLVIGLVLGILGGLVLSLVQQRVYQATGQIMFVQQQDAAGVAMVYTDTQTTAATLSQLMVSGPVLDEVSDRLHRPVNPFRIFITQILDSQVIQIDVVDKDPTQAANLVNTLMQVFIAQQNDLRSTLYASTEQSLTAQIEQVKGQIDALNRQSVDEARQLRDKQVADLQSLVASLQNEQHTVQQELVLLQYGNTPVAGVDASGRWGSVQPTPTVNQRVEIARKTNRLDEIGNLLDLYQRIYVDLSAGNNADPTSPNDSVRVTLNQYQTIYSNLLQNLEAVRLAKMKSTPELEIVEQAHPPEFPIRPNPLLNMSIGGLLGLLISFGAAFAFIYTDDIFRTPEEARLLLHLPVLAYLRDDRFGDHFGVKAPVELDLARVMAEIKRLVAGPAGRLFGRPPGPHTGPSEPRVRVASAQAVGTLAAGLLAKAWPGFLPGKTGKPVPQYEMNPLAGEGLRFLRSNLEVIQAEHPFRSLLVASPDTSSIGAQVAVQLARLIAQSGQRVILVDADLRGPQIASLMDVSHPCGLGDYLLDKAGLAEILHPVDQNCCLTVITAGVMPGDPADRMIRAALQPFIDALVGQADIVILNSPPFAFAETAALTSSVDGVLLAVELDQTRSTAALAAMEQMQMSKAYVVGMVIA